MYCFDSWATVVCDRSPHTYQVTRQSDFRHAPEATIPSRRIQDHIEVFSSRKGPCRGYEGRAEKGRMFESDGLGVRCDRRLLSPRISRRCICRHDSFSSHEDRLGEVSRTPRKASHATLARAPSHSRPSGPKHQYTKPTTEAPRSRRSAARETGGRLREPHIAKASMTFEAALCRCTRSCLRKQAVHYLSR